MTAPRQILPGTTYLLTRRCTQRQFLLTPSPTTVGIFLYVLALAARRFGVQVHAFCVLSNHFHLVVTDPEARLPAFAQYLCSLVARAANASLGRWESFWAPSSYSAVALASPQDIVAKAAYVLANPAAAGLVRRGRDWPGAWSEPDRIGASAQLVPKPAAFFRPNGRLPALAELVLTAPPGFATAAEFRERLDAATAELEEKAMLTLEADGRSVVGPERVLAQPSAGHPKDLEPRRQLVPRVAAKDKWKRIERLGRLVEFGRAYREAWAAFRRGVRDVLFPAGTYLMRVALGVRCAAVT